MKNTGEMLVAFLAGLALGSTAALLAAPETGVRTRRRLRRRAEDAQTYLEDLGEELMERGREMVERGRMTADETVRDITARGKQEAV